MLCWLTKILKVKCLIWTYDPFNEKNPLKIYMEIIIVGRRVSITLIVFNNKKLFARKLQLTVQSHCQIQQWDRNLITISQNTPVFRWTLHQRIILLTSEFERHEIYNDLLMEYIHPCSHIYLTRHFCWKKSSIWQ